MKHCSLLIYNSGGHERIHFRLKSRSWLLWACV
nr:MAG TPA: hypothetical protein [Caudoviricetes sp.]